MRSDEDDLAREHLWKLAALKEGIQHVSDRITHAPYTSEVAPCDSVFNDPRLSGDYDSSLSYLSPPSELAGDSSDDTPPPSVPKPTRWWQRWTRRKL